MSIKGDVIAVGIAGAVLFAAAWYAKKKVVENAPNLNPFDEKNVINKAANSFYQDVTGDKNGTIGTGLYDITHSGPLANVEWWQVFNPGAALGGMVGDAIGKAPALNDGTLNPTSGNNVIYRNLPGTTAESSFGTKLYDWLH